MVLTGRFTLWLRWVAANAVGELIGLGVTFALIAALSFRIGEQQNGIIVLASFAIAVFTGAIEATLVGLLQWWAMRPWMAAVSRRALWLATLAGALAAYILGYLPSTLMSLGEQAGQAQAVEPPQAVVLILSVGLGAIGGLALSFAQWLVFRKKIARAWLWIPANMLAWLAGMPLIFWGVDAAQKGQPLWESLLLIAIVLLVAGAVVGAIHGAFLAHMIAAEKLHQPEKCNPKHDSGV